MSNAIVFTVPYILWKIYDFILKRIHNCAHVRDAKIIILFTSVSVDLLMKQLAICDIT